MNRRSVVIATVTALAVGGGAWIADVQPWQSSSPPAAVGPRDAAVVVAERARSAPDARINRVRLVAAPAIVDLGGRTARTWTFNGTVPGPQLTARAGDVVSARVVNELPAPLTVHWHGIAIRDDMDGVPDVTQPAIRPGGSFTYTFTVADTGTYFYHSHVGNQLDRGLYGALIVQPRRGASTANRDVAVLLDDWVDGTGRTPDDVYGELRRGMAMPGKSPHAGSGMDTGDDAGMDMSDDMGSMPGMDMGDTSPMPPSVAPSLDDGQSMSDTSHSPLGADTADLDYPLYLINGRDAARPTEINVPPSAPIRIRLINAASATPFRVAVAGRPLTVVATDGYPVDPVRVDSLIIGMGERYDVIATTPRTGTAALVAVAEGRSGEAVAVLRTGRGATPGADIRPAELTGRLLRYSDLHATTGATLRSRRPGATYRVTLTGDMGSYRWGIVPSDAVSNASIEVHQGQRVRLVITNGTMMWHPVHLHGHTFQLVTGAGSGPRKDTAIVPVMGSVTVEFDADNPGQWLLHCHNAYHGEAGMTTTLSYLH